MRSSVEAARVRPARRDDIVPLVEMLGREFVPLVPDAAHFDPARAATVLDRLPRILLAEVKDEGSGGQATLRRGSGWRVVGCLALRHDCWWWTGTPFVTDMVFFLAEEARASTLARDLLAAGERYAAGQGLPLLIGVLSGEDLARKAEWFGRRGYRALGGLYLKGA